MTIRPRAHIVAIIPALNEERAIGQVIDAIPRDLVEEVVVVDNGSTDRTADIVRARNATLLFEAERGYGHACMAGILHARSQGADIVVFLDGDHADVPEEMPLITEPIIADRADFVVGSRSRGDREKGALLPQARFGNWLACSLIRWFWHVSYTDLGPFRSCRLDQLIEMDLREFRYGWTVEMQIAAARDGLRIEEVPVSYRKRIGTSKVSGTISGSVRAGVRILYVIFRFALRR